MYAMKECYSSQYPNITHIYSFRPYAICTQKKGGQLPDHDIIAKSTIHNGGLERGYPTENFGPENLRDWESIYIKRPPSFISDYQTGKNTFCYIIQGTQFYSTRTRAKFRFLTRKKMVEEKSEPTSYKPSPKFVLSVRLFEIICGLVVVITLAITAEEAKKLGLDIPSWVIYGLVLSCVSTVVSASVLFFDRSTKFAFAQGILSNIFLVAYIVYTAIGAVHTPTSEKCSSYSKEAENMCAAPKAAEFFSFCVVFAFGFSALAGYFTWWDARRKKRERDASSSAETATADANES